MSEAKFTKGEWAVSNDGTDSIVNNELDLHICSLYSRVDNFTHDAHLIAAAPEMYAMLSQCRDFVSGDENCGPFGLGLICQIDDLLAKARGEK